MKRTLLILAFILLAPMTIMAQPRRNMLRPDTTITFAVRDSQELQLDIYNPATGSQTSIDGMDKPTILFLFGGGFAGGSKSDFYFRGWIGQMAQAGYRVVVPDYRLGLKGLKRIVPSTIPKAFKAVDMAVEDAFAATAWLIEHADSLGLDPKRIVICGSSAGAVTSLNCAYEVCNRTKRASVLPSDFQYAGVMSWSGAVVTRKGMPKYASQPPATLFFHGTADKVVPYRKLKVLEWGMVGSDKLVRQFARKGYTYHIYRYNDNGHEVAGIMSSTTREQFRFLEDAVIRQLPDTIDRTVTSDRLQKRDQTLLNIWH